MADASATTARLYQSTPVDPQQSIPGVTSCHLANLPPPHGINVLNRTLFHGDNLTFLSQIHDRTIDLIATDPPFNKNRDFHTEPDKLKGTSGQFEDRWKWLDNEQGVWVEAIRESYPTVVQIIEAARGASGEDMAAFLCFLGVRAIEMHRILKQSGSLYLHIDHTAHAWTKVLLDAIFGRANFRNEIVWCYPPTGKPPKNGYPRKHDTLLFYSKEPGKNKWKQPYGEMTDATRKAYSARDEDGRLFSKAHGGVTYLDEIEGRPFPDWWTDIGSGSHMPKAERQNFPTQKPLALYKRVIAASTEEGDFVLDPFCGCATTIVAAEHLKRQWIGMDIWEGAYEMVVSRLRKEGFTVDGEGAYPVSMGDVYYSKAPPKWLMGETRTQKQPTFRTAKRTYRPKGSRMTLAEKKEFLLDKDGEICQGCDRFFDDQRYLEVDHRQPRSEGGSDEPANLILLCTPCNRLKGDRLTLKGLRAQNKKLGHMSR